MINESPRRYRWVVMGLLASLDMSIVLAAFSLGVLLPDMSKELQMSPIQAGWLGSTFWMAIAVFSIPSSIFLSHLNPKLICIVAALVGGTFLMLQGAAPDYTFEILARIVFVVVVVTRFQAGILLIQQWFDVREIIKVNSINSSIITVAQVIGVGLVPFLLALFNSWRNVYYLIGSLIIGVGILTIVFGRQNITEAYATRLSSQQGNPLGALRKYRVLWIVASCQLGSSITWTSFLTFWPTFLISTRDVPLSTAGFLMSLFPVGSILGSFSSNFISTRLGLRKPLLIVPGILLPFTYLVMVLGTSPLLLGLFSFITGYLVFVLVPILFSYPFEMPGIKPREVAVGTALIGTITMTGGSLGPLVSGLIQQWTGSLQLALGISTVFAFSIAIVGAFLPETGWRAKSSEHVKNVYPR